MSNQETTIIPLDEAHEVLAAFGIRPSSRGYQRWRREDGFRQVDFEDVLNESTAVLAVDWREWLQDSIDTMLDQLAGLGMMGTVDLGEDGHEGVVEVEGRGARIRYVPDDEGDFDLVVGEVNRLIEGKARYRKFRSCEGSDGWSYAVLKNEDWKALEAGAGGTVRLLFA